MNAERQNVIDICELYIIKGLLEHKPELVPLSDNCTRTELGMNTGRSAEHLRELLRSEIYLAIEDCFDFDWIVEGEKACVFYKQKLSFSENPILIATRFTVREQLIQEIDILFYNHGMMDMSGEAVEALSQL